MSSMISEYGLPETADMMSGIVLQQLRSLKNVKMKTYFQRTLNLKRGPGMSILQWYP